MQEAQTGQVLPLGRYEACWYFEYADGRLKKGVYNYTTNGPDSAFAQPKEGIIRAGIYARCGNRITRRVLNCEGADFCNFEWVASKNATANSTRLIGLTLVTRNERATFFFDGSVEITERDSAEDVYFHYGRQN